MASPLHERGQLPTIGILTVLCEYRDFRGDHQNFIDLIRTGREQGALVYVIAVEDLKLSEGKVQGFTYSFETKQWTKQLMPMPHVFYNRIPYRNLEMRPQVQRIIQMCLKSKQVKLFNPTFFNKWSLFEWLHRSQETRQFVPVTEQLTNANELDTMLRKYDMVYLKPIKGKAGKGILRVERRVQTGYDVGYPVTYKMTIQENKISRNAVYSTLNALWAQIEQYCGNKEYIMQQGILLATYKRRCYDLRVLVQKNRRNEWLVSGIGARLAGPSSITTHVPRGGSIEKPLKLLTQTFGEYEGTHLLADAKHSAILIANQIESASGHSLGEMSLDIGIDTHGKTWFFEANSKPMKFDEAPIRKKSLLRVIGYSQYLCSKLKSR
jgi:hypothetical protein